MRTAGEVKKPTLHGETFSFSSDEDVSLTKEELSTFRKHGHRRTSACNVLSEGYIFRRAYSEQSLLEALDYRALDERRAYLFATEGDVDQLSYLKIAMAARSKIDYALIATWVMAAEDVLQIIQWCDAGRIMKVEFCFGEIFPKQYKVEWAMLREFQNSNEHAGRVSVFKNHSKVILAKAGEWRYTCMTSANVTTNPRTEQACIMMDKEVFDFYHEFYEEKLEAAEAKRRRARAKAEEEEADARDKALLWNDY